MQCTPFPIWNQSVVPCPVLNVASWPSYRLLKWQVRWSGIPISFRIFLSLLWSTQSKSINIDILGISELKWTGMGEFKPGDHYIYYCGQESLRRNGLAIIVNKRVWNAALGYNFKNDRMISVRFQVKPFNITATQVYAPTSNAEEAEVERFYEDLHSWGYWYFSQQSWFQLVLLPVQHFSRCTLHIS